MEGMLLLFAFYFYFFLLLFYALSCFFVVVFEQNRNGSIPLLGLSRSSRCCNFLRVAGDEVSATGNWQDCLGRSLETIFGDCLLPFTLFSVLIVPLATVAPHPTDAVWTRKARATLRESSDVDGKP